MSLPESYLQRVRDLLGGQEAPLIDGRRHILAQCPRCDRTWLQRGTNPVLHLAPEEIRAWAERLHANPADLPRRVCRPCQIHRMGGEFTLDEYADPATGEIGGYGVSWERGLPEPQHFLAGIVNLDWTERRQTLPAPSIVTNARLCTDVLHACLQLPPPRHFQPYSADMLALLTQTNPPGAHAPGTPGWPWRGGLWTTPCSVLGGEGAISFVQALPLSAPFRLPEALALWQQVIRHALSRGIAGA